MTEREMRRLNRADLLELLLAQIRENEALTAKLEIAEKQLADRTITIEKAGSLAEAALQLNGVFEAAQAAAQQYLDNLASLQPAPAAAPPCTKQEPPAPAPSSEEPVGSHVYHRPCAKQKRASRHER